MKGLQPDSISLIYLDPPFFTQREHTSTTRSRTKKYSFSDSWESLDAYLDYMKVRISAMKDLLRADGSIFLHCDTSANHHLRIILEDVFGRNNFRSEIIWSYKRWTNSARGLIPNHQSIYFYSKSSQFKFHQSLGEYSETTNIDQILQLRNRGPDGITQYAKDEHGDILFASSKQGVPLNDVWEIPFLNPKAKERVGYPTQKPILLLERIIELVTDKDDLILDPFMGSGTTLVAAKLLRRRYIGIDISSEAVELASSRLKSPVKSESALLKLGRAAYKNSNAEAVAHLFGLPLHIVQRNKGIDAFLKDVDQDGIYPVRVQRSTETLSAAISSLIQASEKKKFTHGYVVATEVDSASSVGTEVPNWITVVNSVKSQISESLDSQLPK